MLDFVEISKVKIERKNKTIVEIFPTFLINSRTNDLMIRGRDFYAVWDEDKKIWSMDEQSVIDQIDAETKRVYLECQEDPQYAGFDLKPKYMRLSNSGIIDQWHKYVQKQCRDRYHQLDEKLIFANSKSGKRDYSSRRLPYALEDGDISAWDELIGTLYSPEERDKIEWAIGSIVSGDSKKIQKCLFMYGGPGTGKSTVLDIIREMFDGYCCSFDAKEIGNSNASFALESFKDNPLVGIQGDSKMDRIDDNTRLNSIISHEVMEINEKFKSKYQAKFNTFLFMSSNNMVKITDAKSGLTRRIIDVSPTGNTLKYERWDALNQKILNEELGYIAKHCLDRYNALGMNYYAKYVPTKMIAGTNDIYNFVQDMYFELGLQERITLRDIWRLYKMWCEDANIKKPMQRNELKNELMNYFDRCDAESYVDGKHERNVFSGFHKEKFETEAAKEGLVAIPNKSWLELKDASEFEKNVFDIQFADCPAQYAVGKGNEKPSTQWVEVKSTLKDLDTTKTHYVRLPAEVGNVIINIDFDKKNEKGEKSLAENIEAAKDWPKTYAEVSKGGQGLHLVYRYTGDPGDLAAIYDKDVEIKVCNGFGSCRRRLSKCNDIPIATISSGLPLKGGQKMIDLKVIKNEKVLRRFIANCLEKKHHGATAPEVDYIYSELEKCYDSGMKYDVSDLEPAVTAFAGASSNQAQKCLRTVMKMHFHSDEPSEPVGYPDGEEMPMMFYDFEVFPNRNLVCYIVDGPETVEAMNAYLEVKDCGDEKRISEAWNRFISYVVAVSDPKPNDIYDMLKFRLVDFNGRKYDRHIMAGILHGLSASGVYDLSSDMINDKKGFDREAYNYGWLDIYDCMSAGNKASLKKWEIKLGVSHQELGLRWDKPVSDEDWTKVIEYCKNDVAATMMLFYSKEFQADFKAREILADIAGMTVNDTTNQLTTRIIFGKEKKPQHEFVYTDLSELFPGYEYSKFGIDKERYTGKIVNGKSIYRGIDPSEGGRVYAEPGMYFNVALLDIASMHPSSIEALNLFGDRYTKRFSELKLARLYIKHQEFDKAKELFDGKLAPYLDDPAMAKALSNALKTAINSVYGLTSASFENPFKDPRNEDNIVAKRGALFMIELQLTLQEMGYQVAHVKTDSIKIPEATPEVIQFVMDFGKKYGYEFEHEATYERLCLVNESTYIAKDAADGHWTATGAQFQVPYVFKTLFSHEDIQFEDMCETKSVTSALYLDFNEDLPDVKDAEKELSKWEKLAKDSGMTNTWIHEMEEKPIPGSDIDLLMEEIKKGHNYVFIGKVGLFCPMNPGAGGGWLMREKDGKYNSATGAKDYRWMEAETVRNLGLEDQINRGYYDRMVNEAIETIKEFGDFEMFVSDDSIPELPF